MIRSREAHHEAWCGGSREPGRVAAVAGVGAPLVDAPGILPGRQGEELFEPRHDAPVIGELARVVELAEERSDEQLVGHVGARLEELDHAAVKDVGPTGLASQGRDHRRGADEIGAAVSELLDDQASHRVAEEHARAQLQGIE